MDAYGAATNNYPSQYALVNSAQDRPWAIYLADSGGQYRLICFDLDAHANDAAATHADTERLHGFLDEVGIPALECESGPSGGRHLWVGLAEAVDPRLVATLGRLLRDLCPSLDLAPLTNPTTGCVRPPGAPHRNGGVSTILDGDLTVLTQPGTTAHQISALVELVASQIDPAAGTDGSRAKNILADETGMPYLAGARRPLPAASQTALGEDAASGDASAVMWSVLIGAAAARWRYADVVALIDYPGMEHVRTQRDRSTRTPRTAQQQEGILRRQWERAVTYVATTPRQAGEDPTFDPRAAAIAAEVEDIQTRANATPGRWGSGGGPSDRRILDALCFLALQALSPTIEADIRRLGLLCGLSRETARKALLRLAADGWIHQAKTARGVRAAHWKIEAKNVVHTPVMTGLPQAVTRPAGAGAAHRTTLLNTLHTRLGDVAHDIFTPGNGGLGILAGNIYSHSTDQPQTVDELAASTGVDTATLRTVLADLGAHGLLEATSEGWKRPRIDRRSLLATERGCEGVLARRATQYALERELWAWWQREHDWMKRPRRQRHRYAADPRQRVLAGLGSQHHRLPRCANKRIDWAAARAIINQTSEHNRSARPVTKPRRTTDWRNVEATFSTMRKLRRLSRLPA